MYTEKELEKFKASMCPFYKDCIKGCGYCREIKEGICEPVPNYEYEENETSHAKRLRDLNSYEF